MLQRHLQYLFLREDRLSTFFYYFLLRIVERSLIKILNKQLFLAGEVKMIRLITLIITILGVSIGSSNADPKKVGFIYIGPPGDHGWTYMHDVGRQYINYIIN